MQNISIGKTKSFGNFKKSSMNTSSSKLDPLSKLTAKKIKSNNSEISEKLKQSKLNPTYMPHYERVPSYPNIFISKNTENQLFHHDNNILFKKKSSFTIPRLDLKNMGNTTYGKTAKQSKISLLECIDSQRSVSRSMIRKDGFLSQRPMDENLFKNTQPRKESPLQMNESDDLQRDLSHILDKKKKKTNKQINVNLLNKEKRDEIEKPIIGPFLENFKLLNFRKDDIKTDFFSELFELLEKDNDMPLFFLSKEKISNNPENFISTINSERFSFLRDFMSLKTPHDYSHKFLYKLMEDLKKNYPNLFSSSPSGRKDVLNLKD